MTTIMPSAIYTTVFPATVLLPSGVTLHTAKVFVTPEGLYVFGQCVQARADEPTFFSPVDYALTSRPPADYAMRNGWEVFTDAGSVSITKESGCGCGNCLKRWVPTWARVRLAWPRS